MRLYQFRSYLFSFFLALGFFLMFLGCSDDNNSTPPAKAVKTYSISGFVQKGPFKAGSKVVAYQLDEKGQKSGKKVSAVVKEKGAYEVKVPWKGETLVEAEGEYFDEVKGEYSKEKVKLSAVEKVEEKGLKANVNVFTELEGKRKVVLLEEGKKYEEAEEEVKKEMEDLFGLPRDVKASELDISKLKEEEDLKKENAQLLLFSVNLLESTKKDFNASSNLGKLVKDFGQNGEVDEEGKVVWNEIVQGGSRSIGVAVIDKINEFYKEEFVVADIPSIPGNIYRPHINVENMGFLTPDEITIHVELTALLLQDTNISVDFSSINDSALEGINYVASSGTVELRSNGDSGADIVIPIIQRSDEEIGFYIEFNTSDIASISGARTEVIIPPLEIDAVEAGSIKLTSLSLTETVVNGVAHAGDTLFVEDDANISAKLFLKSEKVCSADKTCPIQPYYVDIFASSGGESISLGSQYIPASAITSSTATKGSTLFGKSVGHSLIINLNNTEYRTLADEAFREGNDVEFKLVVQAELGIALPGQKIPTVEWITTQAATLAKIDLELHVGTAVINLDDLELINMVEDCNYRAISEVSNEVIIIDGIGKTAAPVERRASSSELFVRVDASGVWGDYDAGLSYQDACVKLTYDDTAKIYIPSLIQGHSSVTTINTNIDSIEISSIDFQLNADGVSFSGDASIKLPRKLAAKESKENFQEIFMKRLYSKSMHVEFIDEESKYDLNSLSGKFSKKYILTTEDVPYSLILAKDETFTITQEEGFHSRSEGQIDLQLYNSLNFLALGGNSFDKVVSNTARSINVISTSRPFSFDSGGLDFELDFSATKSFTTHYPKLKVTPIAQGYQRIENSNIVESRFPENYTMDQRVNCKNCVKQVLSETLTFTTLESNQSKLLSHGAIATQVQLNQDVHWGIRGISTKVYTHKNSESESVSSLLYIPGMSFATDSEHYVTDYLMGNVDLIENDQNKILENAFYTIDTLESRRGNHFMAGVNVGPQHLRDAQGQPSFTSSLGDTLNDELFSVVIGGASAREFSSNAGSKYLLRPEGITGTFNNQVADLGFDVYGFDMNFDRFSFRNIINVGDTYSWIDGNIYVPNKGKFDLGFKSLGLSCRGDFDGGRIDRDFAEAFSQSLDGWKTSTDFTTIAFESDDAQSCSESTRLLALGHILEINAFEDNLALRARWSSAGDVNDARILGKSFNVLDASEDNEGFNVVFDPESVTMKESWYQLNAMLGLPFWEALSTTIRVNNSTTNSAGQSVVTQKDVLTLDDTRSAESILATKDANGLKAIYNWGSIGFKITLPIYYEVGRAVNNLIPKFKGVKESQDLYAMSASAGVRLIEPDRTGVDFGASVDVAALTDLNLSIHIDINDPVSVLSIDNFLATYLQIGNSPQSDGPLKSSIGELQEKLSIMKRLTGKSIELVMNRVLHELLSQKINGLDPFEEVSNAFAIIHAMPARIANLSNVFLNDQLERVVSPLENLVSAGYDMNTIYLDLPQLIVDTPIEADATEVPSEIKIYTDKLRAIAHGFGEVRYVLDETHGRIDEAQAALDEIYTVLEYADTIEATMNTLNSHLESLLVIGNSAGSQCILNTDPINFNVSTNFGMLEPMSEMLNALNRATDLLNEVDVVSGFASPVGEIVGIDMAPYEQMQRQIHLLSQSVNDRRASLMQGLQTEVDKICASGGDVVGIISDTQEILSSMTSKVSNVKMELLNIIDQQKILFDQLRAAEIDGMMSLEELALLSRSMEEYFNYLADEIDGTYLSLNQTFNNPYDGSLEVFQRTFQRELEQYLAPYNAFALEGEIRWDLPGEQLILGAIEDRLRIPFEKAIDEMTDKLEQGLVNSIAQVPNPTADELRELVVAQIMNLEVVESLRIQANDILSGLSEDIDKLSLQLFAMINKSVQEIVSAAVAEINEKLAGATESFKNNIPIKAVGVDGYAIVAGEELEQVHLSADWEVAGDSDDSSLKYGADFDMRRWSARDEDGETQGCVSDAEAKDLIDITIAARNLGMNLGEQSFRFDLIELGITIKDSIPNGVFGSITSYDGFDLDAFKLYDMALVTGVGQLQNFLGAKVSAIFDQYQLSAAFLAGKTCGDKYLKRLDPEVAEFITLPNNVFNGVYLRGGASIPVYNGGCALTVGVQADMGQWLILGPPLTIGGLVGGGANGEALCIASIKGYVRAMAEVSGDVVKFNGSGWAVAGVGSCSRSSWTSVSRSRGDSWCGTGDAKFEVSYDQGWSLDELSTSAVH